ncbi:hypothetical protein E2C01_040602 [Portunus trituberculatus]|uniref:Uncharacterized protein n=1 Tax=Portunus trituberculatus TaxID=210409 RepID=A0A5B7FK83_PORTR|nr:hypothetical protein [Portunus trituberculatus]
MLPPTLASRGGRGRSLSWRSALRLDRLLPSSIKCAKISNLWLFLLKSHRKQAEDDVESGADMH